MSDLGALMHMYKQWNKNLDIFNKWVLHVRKVKAGIEDKGKIELEIPPNVQSLLMMSGNALLINPISYGDVLPISIKKKLNTKFGNDAEDAGQRFVSLGTKEALKLSEISDEDITYLRVLVSSLDEEVTQLHNRMRRFR